MKAVEWFGVVNRANELIAVEPDPEAAFDVARAMSTPPSGTVPQVLSHKVISVYVIAANDPLVDNETLAAIVAKIDGKRHAAKQVIIDATAARTSKVVK